MQTRTKIESLPLCRWGKPRRARCSHARELSFVGVFSWSFEKWGGERAHGEERKPTSLGALGQGRNNPGREWLPFLSVCWFQRSSVKPISSFSRLQHGTSSWPPLHPSSLNSGFLPQTNQANFVKYYSAVKDASLSSQGRTRLDVVRSVSK